MDDIRPAMASAADLVTPQTPSEPVVPPIQPLAPAPQEPTIGSTVPPVQSSAQPSTPAPQPPTPSAPTTPPVSTVPPAVTPESPVEPTTPSTPKKSRSKILLVLLLILFLFAALAAAGYFYYQNQQLKEQSGLTHRQAPILIPETDPSPIQDVDPTADWHTFTGNGFKIKYPQEMFTDCDDKYSTDLLLFKQPFDCPEGHDIFYDAYVTTHSKSEYKLYKEPAKEESILINNVPATEYLIIFDNEDGPLQSLGSSRVVVFSKDERVFVVGFNGNQFDQDLANNILSTFEFTETSPSTSVPETWSTYTDTSEGIAFRYPETWSALQIPNSSSLSIWIDDYKLSNIPETDAVPPMMVKYVGSYAPDTNQFQVEDISLEEGINRYSESYSQDSLKIMRNLETAGRASAELRGEYGEGQLQGQFAQTRLIKLDDKLLAVHLYNENYKDIFNQILSSFEFTD